ncbi:MAG: AAA family ATPase [Bacteroidales bacterium]|nr:AAA family ATPase [Bacteroidales bacterium]
MLQRKIEYKILEHVKNQKDRVLIIEGARQIGKTYIIRHVGKRFSHYVEINLLDDYNGLKLFNNTRSTDDFYLQLGALGKKLGNREDTLVFLDEIQVYPHLLTLLKFLNQDAKYTYICSGSLLGVTLARAVSIPIGSTRTIRMFPLDFEEFLWANGFSNETIDVLRNKYLSQETLDEGMHGKLLSLFKRYLLCGGLPAAVSEFVNTMNISMVRDIQNSIYEYYGLDTLKYDKENKLRSLSVYKYIPSALESHKKRIVLQDIEKRDGARFFEYKDEFEYLIQAGIALHVSAISNPKFPLCESQSKNLLKLYLNDVGILTNLLYKNNIRAILDDNESINLGTVYESVVAQELVAHNYKLNYYDNKKHGEVDFLIDDFDLLSVVPIEVKSGKDYKVHSALSHFVKTADYHIQKAVVLSNNREIVVENGITYLPIYYVMFL